MTSSFILERGSILLDYTKYLLGRLCFVELKAHVCAFWFSEPSGEMTRLWFSVTAGNCISCVGLLTFPLAWLLMFATKILKCVTVLNSCKVLTVVYCAMLTTLSD